MSLSDHKPKKLTKADEEKERQEKAQKFFSGFEEFQKLHELRLAAVVVHDMKGSHIEFTLVPYEEAGKAA